MMVRAISLLPVLGIEFCTGNKSTRLWLRIGKLHLEHGKNFTAMGK